MNSEITLINPFGGTYVVENFLRKTTNDAILFDCYTCDYGEIDSYDELEVYLCTN